MGKIMNKKIIVFTVATCLFSWLFWIPIVNQLGASPFESGAGVLAAFFAGAYGPTIMGIALTYFYGKKAGLKLFFRRLLLTKTALKWAALALVIGPFLYVLSLALYVALGNELGTINYGLIPWIPVVLAVSVVFGPLAEEFGWRGFLLPLLDYRNKAISSSVIVGFIWALWHAPLFWAQTGTAISGFPVTVFTAGLFFAAVIGSSFIYTFLFSRTNESISIAIMLHLSMNGAGTIVGMFFPEMTLDQRFTLYMCYTSVLWAILALFAGSVYIRSKPNAYSPQT